MNSIQFLDRRLPFIALRSFESFARLGDVAAAADELGITPSAVSHQLSALQTFLKIQLTERQGRRLALTADGRRYFEAVSPAFSLLLTSTTQLRQSKLQRRITISALPLLATGWLMPRLAGFLTRHPGVDIQVQYTRYRNYSSDAADLSLRFGDGNWHGYNSEKLLSGTAFPVCSPALLKRYGQFRRPADFLAAPLVHDGSTEQWARWLAKAGIATTTPLTGMVCEDGMLTRAAMLNGLGIALTRPLLLEQEITAGNLLVLSDLGVGSGEDYYLCTRDDREVPRALYHLIAWLRDTRDPTARTRPLSKR
ncbi:LysR family transcriptional regulator [Bradyrhizobium sp. 61]|uniref:LysR substrate-binding domain-containing protein n=1 Tax=unclassified Bradyrhizobium TaxID=2631580 RepID=UPI001FF99509|nr:MULTISPECIES: LysR substrate-binding domain-containing protein [unclassified Bradyrhizobium]MCK1274679.1 LysR family transcriptional regulator [Bradyrhizobium sp. 61]MCK1441673.1 LysR family transcriptional regulator [Bradyrhizobium sp. 48]MCK1465215.1 LysR family transcriptional regulator [Bradyrhizobium sp. 2]